MRLPGGIIMTIWDNLNELKRAYKATDETIREVIDVFEQGDYRYTDPWNAVIVAGFVDNEAIKIEKEIIKLIDNPSEKELSKIKPPQQFYKFIGKKFLEERGYNPLGFEFAFSGGKVDILAEKPSKDETVVVECCSCRISKAIDYLKKEKTILWIISRAETPNSTRLILHIVKRGQNWNKYLKIHQNYQKKQMDKVVDLLNSLNFSTRNQPNLNF